MKKWFSREKQRRTRSMAPTLETPSADKALANSQKEFDFSSKVFCDALFLRALA
jgi:hypothetical protein